MLADKLRIVFCTLFAIALVASVLSGDLLQPGGVCLLGLRAECEGILLAVYM